MFFLHMKAATAFSASHFCPFVQARITVGRGREGSQLAPNMRDTLQ